MCRAMEVSAYCMCRPICWRSRSEKREGDVGEDGVGFCISALSPKAVLQPINNWLVGCLAGSASEDPSEEHYAPWGDSGAQQSGLLEDRHPLWRLSGNTCQTLALHKHWHVWNTWWTFTHCLTFTLRCLSSLICDVVSAEINVRVAITKQNKLKNVLWFLLSLFNSRIQLQSFLFEDFSFNNLKWGLLNHHSTHSNDTNKIKYTKSVYHLID